MPIKLLYDQCKNIDNPTIVIAKRNGQKLGIIPAYDIDLRDEFNGTPEISFKVSKYYDGKPFAYWNDLKDFRLVWCKEWDMWFEISVDLSEDPDAVKTISGTKLSKAELSQVNLYDVEINTEDDIARDDYKVTTLYNESDAEASLLDRILEKAPHYSIGHVDATVKNIQRMFSFNGKDIDGALSEVAQEMDILISSPSDSDSNGKPNRIIDVYDLESNCLECGYRGEFTDTCPKCGSVNIKLGYGEDSGVYLDAEHLGDNIQYSTDVDSVKNCFRLEAGDDLMTATIANANPNGTSYIWYISDDLKEDMSDELVSKLNAYDDLYREYESSHSFTLASSLVQKYNSLVDKYLPYQTSLNKITNPIVGYSALMNAYYDTIDFNLLLSSSLMPTVATADTSAAEQAAILTGANLSPVAVADLSSLSESSATNAVLGLAKLYVDSRYQVKVNAGSYASQKWTGNFIVTNYSDDKDTATSPTVSITINDNLETYIKQKIEKEITKQNTTKFDIVDIFELSVNDFKTQLKKYSLAKLDSFYTAAQSCIDILIQQGIADKKTWANSDPDLYTELYLPYYQKMNAIQDEMSLRDSEIAVVVGVYDSNNAVVTDGLQSVILKLRNDTKKLLNFENYIGKDLWKEFALFRREDEYSNSNYISDGLDNAQLFKNALDFYDRAKEEIYKSAMLQHNITCSIKNLLLMDEFQPLIDKFKVGNWIRIGVNDNVYRLRLIEYEISQSSIDKLSVKFSDVKQIRTGVSDISSVLNNAASMATSYGAVTKQAQKGKKSNDVLDNWVNNALDLTTMKIVNSADNQNVVQDSNGTLYREKSPITNEYAPEQIKIINKGLFLTDDGWVTSKAGIGEFQYVDPDTGDVKTGYGVIADTIVGNIILSKEVGVYNPTKSIVMDDGGLIVTTDPENTDSNDKAILVQKKNIDENNNVTYTPLLYVDANGNLILNGQSVKFVSSSLGNTTLEQLKQDIDNQIDNIELMPGRGINSVSEEFYLSTSPTEQSGGNWTTTKPSWDQGKYIWTRSTVNYTDGTSTTTVPICVTGNTGAKGDKGDTGNDGVAGKDGVGISDTAITYAVSSSGTTAPTSGWSTSVPTASAGQYVWTKTIWTYTDNTTETGYSVGKIGVGISEVDVLYYLSTSNSAVTGGSWVTSPPTWTDGTYLWSKTKVTYTDGSTSETTPVLDDALNVAHDAKDTADQVNITTTANIEVINQALETKVSTDNYDADRQDLIDQLTNKADHSEIDDIINLQASMLQTQDQWAVVVQQIQDATEDQDTTVQEVRNWMVFGEDGLSLGKSDSSLAVVISNEKVSFTDGGIEVAFISGQTLYITAAVIDTLQMGNHVAKKSDNSITVFKWANNG